MANTLTSRTSAVDSGVVTHKCPGKASGVHMYLKYTKGAGTNVAIVLTFIDPNLSATDEYKPIYLDGSMLPAVLSYTFSASGNYRVPVPMALGETTVKAAVTFTDGADQALVLDFRGE
jgi:hypothetical protein